MVVVHRFNLKLQISSVTHSWNFWQKDISTVWRVFTILEYFFALKARRETSCWIKIFGKKCIETKLYKVNKLYSKLKNGEYLMISKIFAATPFRMRGLYNLSSCSLVGWFGTFSHSQISTGGKIFGCEKLGNKICVGEVEIKVSMTKIPELSPSV